MNGALRGRAATPSSLRTRRGWGGVRSGPARGWEQSQRWAGYWTGQRGAGAGWWWWGGTRKVRGRDQNQGEAGSLSLSPLPLLVPGQVDRRVAANADARQV